jgi:hypothetical protein
MNSHD